MVESSETVTSADVARHYDQLDRFYREIWGEHVHHGLWETGRETPDEATRKMTDLVISKAQLMPGMKVLDLGCGYGGTSRILAQEQRAVVTGLTVSPAQQSHAEKVTSPPGNPVYLVEDWMRNNQTDATYDRLIAIESTEHMSDKVRVFTEAARVLKAGGRIVVCAWLSGDNLPAWQRRHFVEPVCREGRLPAMGTELEYMKWMRDAGFVLEPSVDLSEEVSRTWPICAWRFAMGLFRHPSYVKFMLERKNDNRVFAITLVRIWLAYRMGAMRYVVFSGRKAAKV